MKTFTNHTAGARGINLKGGGTHWIEPGETVELDPETFADGPLPDFGKPGDSPAQSDEIESLKAELTRLTARNTELEALLAQANGEGSDDVKVPATAEEITAAIGKLDKKNEDHWTAAGLPAVEAVAELTGKSVTRKAIAEAAPDALRPL